MNSPATEHFGGTLGNADYSAHFSQSAAPKSTIERMEQEASCPAFGNSCGMQNVSNVERVFSVAAGLGLALAGLRRGKVTGLMLTTAAAGLVYRGLTGHCHGYDVLGINTAKHGSATAVSAQQGYKIERKLVVDRSPSELYKFWRRLSNLPQVMQHLKYVETYDDQHSHWKAEGAMGADVEWDAEIINDREDELIAWRSLPGGDVDTAGSVHFEPLETGGTEVTLSMKYNPPAGKIGAHLASLFGAGLDERLDEDLSRFKEAMETGLPAAPQISTTPFSSRNTPLRGQFT